MCGELCDPSSVDGGDGGEEGWVDGCGQLNNGRDGLSAIEVVVNLGLIAHNCFLLMACVSGETGIRHRELVDWLREDEWDRLDEWFASCEVC